MVWHSQRATTYSLAIVIGTVPHIFSTTRAYPKPLSKGYLPLNNTMRLTTLQRKREEYKSLVEAAFARGREGLDQQIWHQIEIDVPRTRPGVRLWMEAATQRVRHLFFRDMFDLSTEQCLERVLYVWAIRHPASGYVQGINDLTTPFIQVFLSGYIGKRHTDLYLDNALVYLDRLGSRRF